MTTHVDHRCIHCVRGSHGWCDGKVRQYGGSGSSPIEAPCLCTHHLHNPWCLCPHCRGSGWVRLLGNGGPEPTGCQPAREGETHAVPCLTCDSGRRLPAQPPQGEEQF